MSRPIIAITSEIRPDEEDPRTPGKIIVNSNYTAMVIEAGGVPLIVPPYVEVRDVVHLFDGWLIPGGRDIDGCQFGEVTHPKAELQDPSRFELESALFHLIDPQMPILGICLGCQFLNVIQGGTLIQHLPDIEGSEVHTDGVMQAYAIESDSVLGRTTGVSEIRGKSYHHQAIGQLGNSVKVVARHEDGTIEAIEIEGKPFRVGVQWHPERTPDDNATKRLFRTFIEQASEFKANRHKPSSVGVWSS